MAYIFVVGLAINYRKVEIHIERTNSLKLDEIKKKEEEYNNKMLKSVDIKKK